MLIAALQPLLERFTLKIDLRSAPDDQVQLTIVPQKIEGSKFDGAVLSPIALTATAAELDAELAKGADGAIAKLVASRRSLADQIADQEAADTKAAADARDAAKNKSTAPKPAAKSASGGAPKSSDEPKAPEAGEIPANANPDNPATLF